jgi:hypothetical protein
MSEDVNEERATSGKRGRPSYLNPEQLKVMEELFAKNRSPDQDTLSRLAKQFDSKLLSVDYLTGWIYRRKTSEKIITVSGNEAVSGVGNLNNVIFTVENSSEFQEI